MMPMLEIQVLLLKGVIFVLNVSLIIVTGGRGSSEAMEGRLFGGVE